MYRAAVSESLHFLLLEILHKIIEENVKYLLCTWMLKQKWWSNIFSLDKERRKEGISNVKDGWKKQGQSIMFASALFFPQNKSMFQALNKSSVI